jgi:hypothetical protein
VVFSNNLLAGSGGQSTGYEIDQSIRFNDDDSAYLTRTPGSAGNQRTFTLSTWVKFSTIKADNIVFSSWIASGPSAYALVYMDGNFQLRFEDQNNTKIITTRVFRDVAAWYHIVIRVDTTDGTSGDRYQMYINGERQTSFSTESQPAQNYQTNINKAQPHYLGRNGYSLAMLYSDLYQAETHFLDGTAYDASYFGKTNSATGQWIPKKYTGGNYGTNGFYITGETASDLGEDFSGNNNDFTSSGLTSADKRNDSPTLNKATLNPLNTGSNLTLSDGNLTVNGSGTSGFWHRSNATQELTYKTYWEVQVTSYYAFAFGLNPNGVNPTSGVNNAAGNTGVALQRNEVFIQGSYANESSGARTFPISNGDYIMLAYDPDRNAFWAGVEGTWMDGTGSSASSSTILSEIEGSGTSYAIFTGIGVEPIPFIAMYASNSGTVRFSSEDWEGTAPTGYEQLAPSALPDPTIADPSNHFDTKLWTGNDTDGRAITGYNFQPDWVWIKSRSGAYSHNITDAVRGAGVYIQSNGTDAQVSGPGAFGSTLAFTSDGYTLDNGTSDNLYVNAGGETYVGWAWKANGSGSSNSDGSITSTVSADATSGFSIIRWTGTAANGTIGHGLGVQPSLYILKNTATTNSWIVGSTLYAATAYLSINNSDALATGDAAVFNSTHPTSSVINLGSNVGTNGSSGANNMIAYCFAEVEGFSKFTLYEGNASTDGPFINCGFRPSFVLIKNIDAAEDWWIQDAAREPFNGGNMARISPNSNAAESDNVAWFDFVSNGLKIRYNAGGINSSGTHIVMAFAESPFKTATAR